MAGCCELGSSTSTLDEDLLRLRHQLVDLGVAVPHQLGHTVQPMGKTQTVHQVGVQGGQPFPGFDAVSRCVSDEEPDLVVVKLVPQHLEEGGVDALLDGLVVCGAQVHEIDEVGAPEKLSIKRT